MWAAARVFISRGLQAVGLVTVAKSVDKVEEKEGNIMLALIVGLLAIILLARR